MKFFRMIGLVLARFCMSSIFLVSGMHKILHWNETEKNLIDVLFDWQGYASFSDLAVSGFSFLIGWTPALLIGATLLEFVGGLLLLLGAHQRLGAALLALFLLPTNFLMHPFWFFEGNMRELETLFFMKDLAILGGLFFLMLPDLFPEKKLAPIKLKADRFP